MKFVHAKLPDCQCLEHRALAAVVAPDQQVKLSEVIDLFAYALEIAQDQSSNHPYTPLSLLYRGITTKIIELSRSAIRCSSQHVGRLSPL